MLYQPMVENWSIGIEMSYFYCKYLDTQHNFIESGYNNGKSEKNCYDVLNW